MEKRVFSTQPFLDAATEDFVLVHLDYSAERETTPEEKKELERLEKLYGNPPLPTVFFADSQGRPFNTAEIVMNTPAWLVQLREAKRDAQDLSNALATASAASDEAKASELKKVTDLLPIATLKTFYPEVIADLKEADPKDTTGFFAEMKREEKLTAFLDSIDQLYEDGKLDEIISEANELLGDSELDPSRKQEIILMKANVYYEQKDYPAAMEALDALIAIDRQSDIAKEAADLKKGLAKEMEE